MAVTSTGSLETQRLLVALGEYHLQLPALIGMQGAVAHGISCLVACLEGVLKSPGSLEQVFLLSHVRCAQQFWPAHTLLS